MAALVSHAMRRFPSTPPDTSYSSYRLRGESSRQESGESALSRSMRYADPWLYGGVRPQNGGLLLAPALVLCSCPDYINGTTKGRSGISNGKKSSPTTCKKCKGTRLPLSTLESTYKFGTVRCYPTAALHQSSTPQRAGTVRVSSATSRPSILPVTHSQDPYDLMRRSRLTGPQERARSVSPKNKTKGESKSSSTSKSKGSKSDAYNLTIGRKSILECDINPYELVSSNDFKPKDQDITLVNGQRIRVRSSISDKEYENIQIKQITPTRTAPPTPKEKNTTAFVFTEESTPKPKRTPPIRSPLSSPKLCETDLSGRFKSILKKPSTFGDSDSSSNIDRTPSPSRKTGSQKFSQFYLPTPVAAPRKKVQFLMEKELELEEDHLVNAERGLSFSDSEELVGKHASYEKRSFKKTSFDEAAVEKSFDKVIREKSAFERNVFTRSNSEKHSIARQEVSKSRPEGEPVTMKTKLANEPKSVKTVDKEDISTLEISKNDNPPKNICLLKRSLSDSVMMEQKKIRFNDTMALRNQKRKSISKTNFVDPVREEEALQCTAKLEVNETVIVDTEPADPETSNAEPNKSKTMKSNIKSNIEPSLENIEKLIKDEPVFENDLEAHNSISHEHIVDFEEHKAVQDSENLSKNDQKLEISQEGPDQITSKTNTSVEIIPEETTPKYEDHKPSEEAMIEKLDKCLAKEVYSDLQIPPSPPSAPPRKRSNNKQPHIKIPSPQAINKIRIETAPQECPNKTIVQVNATPVSPSSPTVHKIQIKNEYLDSSVQNINVLENPQRKTSILINGDECYSTVNVSNNIPLYQSSVVVNDVSTELSPKVTKKNSSTVYITGTFISSGESFFSEFSTDNSTTTNRVYDATVPSSIVQNENVIKNNEEKHPKIEDEEEEQEEKTNSKNPETPMRISETPYGTPELSKQHQQNDKSMESHEGFSIQENDRSSQLLKELLRDPVEAVRRNLVPHVCGKSDVSRRPHDRKVHCKIVPNIHVREPLVEPRLEEESITQNSLEESFLRLRNYEAVYEDGSASEHSSSTQYELMDAGSECYTDHSNRSSVTEEELANRTKFYELLADSAIIELTENEDHHYESIKMNSDPIYEEIEIPPPLPSNPPPTVLMDDLNLDKEFTTRSIFEGASKYDILSYLVDAKERGIVQEDTFNYSYNNGNTVHEEETKEDFNNRVSDLNTVSDSYEDNSLTSPPLIDDKISFQKTAEVERNDSGVGSETSKSSLSKYRTKQEISILCEDCESNLENKIESEPLLCRKCSKKRSERKEIITEIVETEEKYSRDLQIILEEFYQPMLVAGLLTPDQLSAIFLNAEELLENSQALAERLRDAVEIAQEQGDDDLLTVNIGKLFLESTPMLHAFETYCVGQGAASLLLASLEKEKELLRIFLRVSQMENTMLRRMNLNSFLMVPVQRVTKYPLLLSRLYKVTPSHHDYKEELKEAQHKIELHLNHMNSETKDVPSKLWRRIGSSSGRRSSAEMDLVNIKLRKIAVDVLEWNHEEAKFVLEGKLLFTQPTDNNWRKGRTIKLTPINALLVINGKPSSNKSHTERSEENGLIFAKPGTKEAALLLVRDKNGRYSLLREPLYLDRCIIAADPAWQSYFEVQELMGKDTFIFKAECEELTQTWYKQLQYHAQGMGSWRKRRNALANIMINGMGLRS